MKKAVIIPLVLIVSLIFAFCSCGSKTDNGETTVRESFYSGSRTYPVSVVTGPLTGSVSTRLTEISTSLLTQPVTEPPVLPPVVPVSVSGSYLLDLGEHGQDDPAAVRLELLEKGGRLGVLLTMVYDTYEWTSNFYIVEPTESEGTVSAVYDGESEHFELTCDGKIADLDFLWEGNVDPASGRYLRSDSSEGEFRYPDIPEKEKDPDTPDGAIDRVIAASARESLGLPSDSVLTVDDCANVTELNIFEDRLVSLDGIEYFSDLKKIYVNSSYLSDISPLASIKSLEEISIGWSYIETIPDFSGCKNLVRLDLACNAISDISPLSSLKNLKFLNLSSNNVKSIAPIKDITSFEYL
ncbi:MAG: leucine-rich repeat domain-containing protein, partial [Clostridia bacterium]|nr:leucine-rich repeat domain-containing protein [Clostridia bacterium]